MVTTAQMSLFAAHSVTSECKAHDRERVYAVVAASPDGATDDELQDVLGMDGNSERPRRGELVVAGRIRPSGRTRSTRSGRQATVWMKA